jgi:hypothetical protein
MRRAAGNRGDGMKAKRKVTVEVSRDLLRRAQRSTGEGVTGTVRRGLELVAAAKTYDKLRGLRAAPLPGRRLSFPW